MDRHRIASNAAFRPAAAGASALALYVPTLAPGVWAHDSGELTAAAYTLGIAHPAGSPLYMLLCKLVMAAVPFGTIAWRANLFSALAGAAAVAVLSLVFSEEGLPPWADAGVALTFGASRTFWSVANVAEVYTLNFLVLALVLLFLGRHGRTGAPRWARAAALFWGLLLANYVAYAALTLPFLVIWAWATPRRLATLRLAGGCAGLVLLGLSLYLYLPIRVAAQPEVNWGHLKDAQDILDHLQSRRTQGRAFSLPAAEYALRLRHYASFPLRDLGLPILAGAIPLAAWGLRRRHPLALYGAVLLLFDAFFVVCLDSSHLASEAYGIPATFGLTLAASAAAAPLAGRFPRQAAAVLLLGAAAQAARGYRPNDRHDTHFVEDEARHLLAALPPGAALFAHEDSTVFALAYLRAVERLRPDVRIFDHWGNLHESAYPAPLHRVRQDRAAHVREHESRKVRELLAAGVPVVFADGNIEYVPDGFRLETVAGVAVARTEGDGGPPLLDEALLRAAPRLGPRAEEDWMIRQLVAMRLVRHADAALAAGDRSGALDGYRQAASRAGYWEIHVGLGQKLLALGAAEEAAHQARLAIAERPARPVGHVVLATALGELGRQEEAADVALRAGRLPGAPVEAHTLAGRLLAELGRFEEARTAFGLASTIEPSEPRHQVNLGILARRRGECAAARRHFEAARALASEPAMADAVRRQLAATDACSARR